MHPCTLAYNHTCVLACMFICTWFSYLHIYIACFILPTCSLFIFMWFRVYVLMCFILISMFACIQWYVFMFWPVWCLCTPKRWNRFVGVYVVFQLYGLCLTCLTIFILICVRMLVCVFNCGLTVGFCSAFIFAVVFICKNMYMCFIYSISRNGPIGPKTNMDKQSSPHQNLVRDWFWCGNLSFL